MHNDESTEAVRPLRFSDNVPWMIGPEFGSDEPGLRPYASLPVWPAQRPRPVLHPAVRLLMNVGIGLLALGGCAFAVAIFAVSLRLMGVL
jgi:hypothetical protein